MITNQSNRCVVLGLDGFSQELARFLGSKGIMPNLFSLVDSLGGHSVLSEFPETSPVNWTSIFTGQGPAEHGVFGFARVHPRSYDLHVSSFNDVQCPTLFESLASRSFRFRIINLPNTYPARVYQSPDGTPLSVMISGFVAYDFDQSIQPHMYRHILRRMGYTVEGDTKYGSTDLAYLLLQLRTTLESRRKALELLWSDLQWDLFFLVVTETDRLLHFFYSDLFTAGNGSETQSALYSFLRELDGFIGDIYDRYLSLPEPKRFMVVSDHGFRSCSVEFNLPAWLIENDYLRPTRFSHDIEPNALPVHPLSSVFALEPGRIYLHTNDRFPMSKLSPRDLSYLEESLVSRLSSLTYNGSRVFRHIYSAHDLYNGSCRDAAPDLICVAEQGFDVKCKYARAMQFGYFGRSGTHSYDDALFVDTCGSRPKRTQDIGLILLSHFISQTGRILL